MSRYDPEHPGFLVWNPDARYPRFDHDTADDARREAERLARENPGQDFYVMAPVMAVSSVPPAPQDREVVASLITATARTRIPF